MKPIAILLLASLLLTGCAPSGQSLTESVAPLAASAEEPNIPLTKAGCFPVSDFSYRLLAQCVQGDKNVVISPLSAYLCLAMLQNGASGDTLKEFEDVLGFSSYTLNQTGRSLMTSLTQTAGHTKLSIADSAWLDDDAIAVKDAYLQAVKSYFDAEVFSCDLPSERTRKAVNEWVSAHTEGMIPTLREENYPVETRLVLINTLYFKAQWSTPFMAESTHKDTFTRVDGSTLRTDFMHQHDVYYDYFKTRDMDGAILPYDDHRTVFVALRPQNGQDAAALAASLSARGLADCLNAAKSTRMDLSVPKFTATFTAALNEPLKAMGLTSVFDAQRADLSGLATADSGPLWVDLVQQKVKLIVDEKGTEAAAVTEAAAAGSAFMQEPPLDFKLDHPFVYALIDQNSGVPLFTGVLNEPGK